MIRMLRGAIKMKRGFKKILSLKGATMQERMKNDIRDNVSIMALLMQN